MNRQERISLLAEENRRRKHMLSLRERYSDYLGYEVSDEQFLTVWPPAPPLNIGLPDSPRPEGLRTFQRFHLPEDFVEKSYGLCEEFGRRVEEERLMLQTHMHYTGVPGEDFFPWLAVDARVFSRILEWSRTRGGRRVCVCDTKVENGFCLRIGGGWGMDTEYEGHWTLEVFGERWALLAEEVFDFEVEPPTL